jgi:hypothetical protein
VRNGLFWSFEDDARLRDLVRKGKCAAIVAKQLGRTEEAIRNRCHVQQISFKSAELDVSSDGIGGVSIQMRHGTRRWTVEDDTALTLEVAAGTSIDAIATKIERTAAAIRNRAYVLRLKLNGPRSRKP